MPTTEQYTFELWKGRINVTFTSKLKRIGAWIFKCDPDVRIVPMYSCANSMFPTTRPSPSIRVGDLPNGRFIPKEVLTVRPGQEIRLVLDVLRDGELNLVVEAT